MVIKGGSRGGAGELAKHLQRTDTNERMELREVRGVVAGSVDGALREMEAVSAGARSRKPVYHASINTPRNEELTEAHALGGRLEAAFDRFRQMIDPKRQVDAGPLKQASEPRPRKAPEPKAPPIVVLAPKTAPEQLRKTLAAYRRPIERDRGGPER